MDILKSGSIPFVASAETVASFKPGGSSSRHDVLTDVVIVDLAKSEDFEKQHIAGARNLSLGRFVRSDGKIGGLLPTAESLQSVLADLGISATSWIVAYDQQGNHAASRFIWTLHAYDCFNCSLLDGGLSAWSAANLPTQSGPTEVVNTVGTEIKLEANTGNTRTVDDLLKAFTNNSQPFLIDARSRKEFDGEDVRAARGGHIPGANWLEWTDLSDPQNHGKLRSDAQLKDIFATIGLSDKHHDQEIVAYCQTHQRSSLTYVALRHLGYSQAQGLEGAWSEWGNRDDTPISTSG